MDPLTTQSSSPTPASLLANSREVISLCSKQHLDVWRLTSSLLPEFIEASRYIVLVPETEMLQFNRVTDSRIEILPQEIYGNSYRELLMEKLVKAKNQNRYGWYLQQFLKIEALLSSSAEQAVIWDSDCVPVRSIQTFDALGRAVYMRASLEFNSDYFEFISRVSNKEKLVDYSFVIPSFPLYTRWIKALIESLEELHQGSPWHSVLLDNIDFALRSGFSETETLGTWISHTYSNCITTSTGNWERRGQKRFGYARDFTLNRVLKIGKRFDLDVITFENWDVRGWHLIKKRLSEFLISASRHQYSAP
jgi:hypothetical protein